MKDRPVSASMYAKVSLLASGIALMALAGMFAIADDLVSGGFRTALMEQARNADSRFVPQHAGVSSNSNLDMYAASEDFWLGHAARTNAVPISWSDSLQVGDTVTFSSKGRTRVLQVETVAPVNSQAGGGAIAQETPTVFVVTARETGGADGGVMRFVVDDRSIAPRRRDAAQSNHDL